MELRDLPSVDELITPDLAGRFPHAVIVREARAVLDSLRRSIRQGSTPATAPSTLLEDALQRLAAPSLRKVINATGVVLHTNLGRAPLPAFNPETGYTNLEYDLAAGRRGKRDTHFTGLLERLLGAPAIAVNNNASAVYLALHELAAGHEVIVSRGELIEIGDGFRIPAIMERSGAILREVGATNRTSLDDYRAAITARTRLILRVHPSNFHVSGFTGKPSLGELAALGREHGVPVYEDLGSGCLVDLNAHGIAEPLVGDSLRAGIDLVSFSCDKLLGGPQTGILAGRPDLVERLRRNPMYRAFRCDKLIVQALETTLRHLLFERYDQLPALRMIRLAAPEIGRRAEQLAARLEWPGATVIPGESLVGGGSTPDQKLQTRLLALPGDAVKLERALRAHTPPVVARIEHGLLLIDLRTVDSAEEPALEAALRAAYAR
ncbi:MAG: L-seryl-tRNA(Sec) selenium transferase [Acidobacteria bacterium]|nr:L-seryl-tRNA(Sec) selenium transferase [Acidobacteriota bacterium]